MPSRWRRYIPSKAVTDLLVNYDYAGSFVRQRIYDNPAVTHTPTYDSFGRVSTLASRHNGSDLVKFTYSYDNNSNIISQKFDHRTSTPSNIYTYDALDRLIQADYIDTTNEQFTFDDLDIHITLHNRAGNDVAYAHNTANEYTQVAAPVAHWRLNENAASTILGTGTNKFRHQ